MKLVSCIISSTSVHAKVHFLHIDGFRAGSFLRVIVANPYFLTAPLEALQCSNETTRTSFLYDILFSQHHSSTSSSVQPAAGFIVMPHVDPMRKPSRLIRLCIVYTVCCVNVRPAIATDEDLTDSQCACLQLKRHHALFLHQQDVN